MVAAARLKTAADAESAAVRPDQSTLRAYPDSSQESRLADLAAKYHNGDSYYTGKQNLHERIPRSSHAYPEEFHRL